ncbi:MAG: hypothetical protein FD127_4078 [Acidimicrobiaceae bacterium]|nr:MAG: hypothetical protein FD127_4078 [Acidimicrobiaceae bacterium]
MTTTSPGPEPDDTAQALGRCLTKIGELEASIAAVAAELARRIDTLEHTHRADLDRHRSRLDGIDEYLAQPTRAPRPLHPDAGGDPTLFHELQRARETLR